MNKDNDDDKDGGNNNNTPTESVEADFLAVANKYVDAVDKLWKEDKTTDGACKMHKIRKQKLND